MNDLHLVGRERPLFAADLEAHDAALRSIVRGSRFLVLGAAGSIGRSVVRELFVRGPRVLHAVDVSENNLVELVRDLRSSIGYTDGEFRTFALDVGSVEFEAMLEASGGYDYVLNLSALKHVRSERDPYTLMRLIEVNVVCTEGLRRAAAAMGARKYFCVSTDKATNPVNMMGCSKRIMELLLFAGSDDVPVSTARFANVAFSDGSLLHGFAQRIAKDQPLSAPRDVRRYFVTQQESGVLCVASCLLGGNREIFYPKLDPGAHLVTFAEIAVRYLERLGYEPLECATEDEARERVAEARRRRRWPVHFFDSDTTGEKPFEAFHTAASDLDTERFHDIGVIRNGPVARDARLAGFLSQVDRMRAARRWSKSELVEAFVSVVPEFAHAETGRYLDDRM